MRKKSIITKKVETNFGRKAANRKKAKKTKDESPFDENGFVKQSDVFDAATLSPVENEAAPLEKSEAPKALRVLSEAEELELAECEADIEQGLRSYLTMGGRFQTIKDKELYLKTHSTFGAYVWERWKFKPTGASDLMKSYRLWKEIQTLPAAPEVRQLIDGNSDQAAETLAQTSVTPEVLEAKPVFETAPPAETLSDAAAPSQRAIDELGKFRKHLQQGEMTAEDFDQWTAVATRALFDFIRETTQGEITQKRIHEVTEALIEISTRQAVEIDGEDRRMNAADIQITREQFESIMRDKQAIFDFFEEKRKRLSEPKSREGLEENKKQPYELVCLCAGKEGHGEQPVYAVLHGAIQLLCGCVFGFSGKSKRMIFDRRLTATNEISVAEREEFLNNKLNQ